MSDTNNLQAKKAFDTFCKMLDNREWKYKKDEEALRIETGARGDDLPINLRVVVDAERMIVRLYSPFEFNIPAEKLSEAALCICIINDGLIDGCFDLDVTDGSICFRMATSFRESLISEEAFDYFLGFAVYVVDEYNDKLLMVGKGLLTPQQLLEDEQG